MVLPRAHGKSSTVKKISFRALYWPMPERVPPSSPLSLSVLVSLGRGRRRAHQSWGREPRRLTRADTPISASPRQRSFSGPNQRQPGRLYPPARQGWRLLPRLTTHTLTGTKVMWVKSIPFSCYRGLLKLQRPGGTLPYLPYVPPEMSPLLGERGGLLRIIWATPCSG